MSDDGLWMQAMQHAAGLYIVLLGACLGSFVNVVVARLPEQRSVVRPRSACPRCGHTLAWYDNIPIVSYVVLRGRCRQCRQPIALRYVIVETLMAALAAALYVRLGMSWSLVLWLPLSAALLAITFLDIDHWWVPDVITLPAMVCAAAASFLPGGVTPMQALWGLGPAALLFAVAWVFERVTQRPGLGLGDVKLLALLGLALGPAGGLAVLLLGSVQGAVVGTLVVLLGGHQGVDDSADAESVVGSQASAQSVDDAAAADGSGGGSPAQPSVDQDDWEPPPRAIPFGPFLVLGALEVLLLPHVFEHWHRQALDVLTGLLG